MKELEGICLSGLIGRLEVRPAHSFQFVVHQDSQQPITVQLCSHDIIVNNHSVSLGKNPSVNVIEHLFSALYGLGNFGVQVDVYGNEIPFFDGSSRAFTTALENLSPLVASEILILPEPIRVGNEESYIHYEPGGAALFIDMQLVHPFVETQRITLELSRKTYVRDIAPARTFVFTSEDDPRLENIPPYGIGITNKAVHSAEPLRFPDEPVRHKVLDLLGDLYVLQRRIIGKISAKNSSHLLNLEFVKKICSYL